MTKAQFIHLHNHSEYSLMDGMLRITNDCGKPSEFLNDLAEKKVPALALTDHGNMYGAMDFYYGAAAVGIKPIIGCEVYMAEGSRLDKASPRDENGPLTLLAKNQAGYQNLMKLASKGFLEGFCHDPRIDLELLEKHRDGLIVLSGCLKSHISRACSLGNIDRAVKIAARYSDIMGKGSFFLELMDHHIPEETAALIGLLEVARRTGLPTVATNDCHYHRREDWEAHEAHLCISTGTLLSDPGRMTMSSREFYFKSAAEMLRLFAHTPLAIKNTLAIAEMCDLKIEPDRFTFPRFDLPAGCRAGSKGESAEFKYLKDRCLKGLKAKLGKIGAEYETRMAYELGVIREMKFENFFLIVMDLIKYARSHGIPVGPGRGSGAGSLVAFALDITRVDPISHGLLFERFLNPDRYTLPDLDIDFSDTGRARIVDYIRRKYGVDHVANIITYNTIKAKTAVRDLGRVMEIPLPSINAIVDRLPESEALARSKDAFIAIARTQNDPRILKLFTMAQKIEGLRRQTSVHAAGIVITEEAITNYVPLANRNNSGTVVAQYDGNMLTRLGLMKLDFLGLRTLDIIERASELIRKGKIKRFDIYEIPFDDKNTYDLLCQGHTAGIFQLESEGMIKLIKGLKPSCFSDIASLVALYRPGPIQSGMLDLFIERKHGYKKIAYDYPDLEPILKDTYGTIVYQEQVMQIAKKLAYFTPGEADRFRKAMGKKMPKEISAYRAKFIEGAEMNNIQPTLADKIFATMLQFAGYGFNKSHSIAYALVGYQTAWLKANYPKEFMTALLESEKLRDPRYSNYKLYREEARRRGITLEETK